MNLPVGGYRIRLATAEDQQTIKKIVKQAGLNRFGLEWSRFIVAELESQIIAVGQVKPYADNTRLLSSIAVDPAYQNQGLGTELVNSLLTRETDSVYLYCRSALIPFYQRFGFDVILRKNLPAGLARRQRVVSLLGQMLSLFLRREIRYVIMARGPTSIR